MKKLLLFFFALLAGVSGAWADELPSTTWNISSQLPTDSWVAMGENTPAGVTALGSYTAYYRTQEVTLTTAGMIDVNFLYSSGNHRLEILGVDALNGSDEVVASDYHFGFTGTGKNLNDYFLNNLSTGTYTLRYIINGNVSSSVGNITIRKFEADVVASLPDLTTDTNYPKYYSIRSYDRGGYLTSNGAGSAMTHVDFAAGSSWYFTAINGNNSGSVIGGVIAHCSDGTQMKQNWQTAASGQTVYLLPNGVNTNGFSISKTYPISSWSCCDANNTNTGVGDWQPASNDWKGTTWVIEPTIPIDYTGYYYFKGMATDRYPYLYSDFVGKSENNTYHHSPLSGKNGEVWKVTNNGTTFNLTNGEGLPLTIGSTAYETLTLSAASAGPDYYFTEAINLTNSGNDTKLTTWADHPDATDNHWTFELVDVSAGVYNVVVQGNDAGYVTYSGQNAKNGGFFVAGSIAVGDLTAHSIDNYESSVSISGRTITVTYTELLSYTLTDMNGETYEGTFQGIAGTTVPTFTGCDGYTLTDGSWSGTAYSATINFPFAVSSNEKDNYTFIGQFNNKNGYSATEFLWHVNGTSIIIHSGDLPTTEDSDHDKYLWSIIPAFSDGAFTFTIKNKSTGTYVNSTYAGNRHNEGDVTLSETATPMTYNSATPTGTCSPINAWYLPSTSKYLSANSVFNAANAVLGVFGTVHDGISTGFPTYGDLISIYWSSNGIAANIAKAGQCGYPSATNEYIVALNGVKTALDGGSYPSTANSYNNLRTWYQGALSADVIKPEVGKFYKFKSANNRYIHAVTPGNIMQMNADGSSADAIFYIPYAGRFLSYTKGYAMSGRTIYNGYYNSGGYSTYTIDHYAGHGLGTIRINGGTYLFDYSGSTDIYDSSNGTNADRYWTVEEVTSLPVTIGGSGYATLYSPVALEVPDGVTAFWGENSAVDDAILVHAIKSGEVIPANNGVVLYSGTSDTYNFGITTGGSLSGTNVIQGTVATKARDGEYTLQIPSEGGTPAFFGDGPTNLQGFKAYLASGTSYVMRLIFDDEETVVKAIEAAMNPNKAVYDMNGRRVENPAKGIYIVNGRKVVIK